VAEEKQVKKGIFMSCLRISVTLLGYGVLGLYMKVMEKEQNVWRK